MKSDRTTALKARAALALLAGLAASPAALAQSVDYGALEQIFGEPITTSATGKPQKASNAPADLVILTQDDIRRSGADNIPDILRFVTGIDVRTYGFADSEVAIRGYNQPQNPRLLVLVNGRQVYLDDYGYVAWSTIPVQLDEIRQIEVIKGPNSALYGFNAASGVINIITIDPIKDTTNAVTVRTGTQSLAEASVVGTAHLSDTAGIRLSAGGFTAREFSSSGLDPSDSQGRLRPRNGTFNLEGSWQALPNLQVTAEGGVVNSQTGLADLGGDYLGARYRIDTARLGLSVDTALGLFGFDFYRNEARNAYLTSLGTIDLSNTVYVAKISDLLKVDHDNTIRLGLEYRHNSATGEAFGGTIGYSVYSADAMWSWQVLPTVSITNAVRIDYLQLGLNGSTLPNSQLTPGQYNRTTVTEPSFNSGVVWNVTPKDTLRLTAARGVQVPSLFDYAFQLAIPEVQGLVYGNPALTPTAVWNFELGYDRAAAPINSVVRTAVFYQVNNNLLAAAASVPFSLQPSGYLTSQSTNIGSSDEVGIEIGIKGKVASGWRWNASYSFASITDNIEPGLSSSPNFFYRHGTPEHTVILGGGYTRGKWELDVQGRWQSSFGDFKDNTISGSLTPVNVPNYVTLNARIGYQLNQRITLSGTAQQFNVSRVLESAGPPVERRLIVAATARF